MLPANWNKNGIIICTGCRGASNYTQSCIKRLSVRIWRRNESWPYSAYIGLLIRCIHPRSMSCHNGLRFKKSISWGGGNNSQLLSARLASDIRRCKHEFALHECRRKINLYRFGGLAAKKWEAPVMGDGASYAVLASKYLRKFENNRRKKLPSLFFQ